MDEHNIIEREKERLVFLCEDSVDGIFTAIYKAWQYGTSRSEVAIRDNYEFNLFNQCKVVETDYELAQKVGSTIREKVSFEAYRLLYSAALSDNTSKCNHIYRFMIKAIKKGDSIIDYMQDDDVASVLEMSRRVNFEAHRYMGFVRFEELDTGLLLSRINPRANIIPIIAEHFADRLKGENWVIYDTNRNYCAIYKKDTGYVFSYEVFDNTIEKLGVKSDQQLDMEKLWNTFFNTIAIKERENYKLQRQMMPLRFRKYM